MCQSCTVPNTSSKLPKAPKPITFSRKDKQYKPICPIRTPPVIPIEHKTPKVPRKCRGDISAIYIGSVLVVKPQAKPTTNRAIISIITEFAIRQKKNKTALSVYRKALANNDCFLKIS